MNTETNVNALIGKVLTEIVRSSDEMIFHCEDGSKYKMYHEQDCCEGVAIEDIIGDLDDLIGKPILKASEDTNSDNAQDNDESHTWTFYNLATIKGYVTIRWYGSSNGYYSESVTFEQIAEPEILKDPPTIDSCLKEFFSELEHTPGPWNYAIDEESGESWIVNEQSVMFTDNWANDPIAHVGNAANAQFFASAPNMLYTICQTYLVLLVKFADFADAYPKFAEKLTDEFNIKIKRDLKAYIHAEFQARGSGEATVINNHYAIPDSSGRTPQWEMKASDGYLSFRATVYDSLHAPYSYTYDDTLQYAFHMKRKWLLGKEKLYGSGMLSNKKARITKSTAVLINDFKDKRFGVGPFVGVDYRLQATFGISVHYSLFKF